MSTVRGYAADNRIFPPDQAAQPGWLDKSDFPFESRYLPLDGHRIHYIDEGRGPLLLFCMAIRCGRSSIAIL